MSVIWFLLFGLIIGFIARAIFPGRQSMGLAPTTLLGCAGSLIGGFIGNLISGTRELGMTSAAGFFGSVVGALALLAIVTAVSRARQHHEHGVR
jgi:uncharacterized membrane protein YeaQ/YmgE (transglycosylase-associated protein family)